MAKKRKTPTTAKRTPPSIPPLSRENNLKEGWWRTLKQFLPYLAIVVTLLGIPIGIFLERWLTELGENTRLKTQLERAEKQVGNQSKELEKLREKNEALESLHPILKFYGADAKIIRTFDLKKEKGERIRIGNCPNVPCLIFTMDGIYKDVDGIEVAWLLLEGNWEGMVSTAADPLRVFVPLKKECRTTFTASRYDVVFVIEDDRYSSLKAGVGISIASSPQRGIVAKDLIRCP